MRPLTYRTPKPLLPLANRPHLDHVFAFLRQHDITDVVLAVQYHADAFEARYGDGSAWGIRLTVVREDEPRGTAGAVKNVEAHLTPGETLLVFNGDILTDLNLQAMIAFHRANGSVCTIALTPVSDPSAYGVVDMDRTGRITRFTEKPKREEATSNLINAGTYVLEWEAVQAIPAGTHYMFERGLFPGLLEQGRPMYGYPDNAYWIDIGTPEKYLQAHRDILDGRMHNPITPRLGIDADDPTQATTIWTGDDVEIDPTAELAGPLLIGAGSRIGPGARLIGPAVLGAGCRVDAEATVTDAVLWDRVQVGQGTIIHTAVLAHDVQVAAEAQITGGSLIADGCRVEPANQLTNGVRLGPGTVLPERAITFS
jgi:mannose-1-phosphate guanylyltransferase